MGVNIKPPEHPEQQPGADIDQVLEKAKSLAPLITAVIHPCDALSLTGALEAKDLKLIDPILVGPEHRIRQVAEQERLALDGIQIVNTKHSHDSAECAVQLVRKGIAQALMKGALHTDEVMTAVLDKENGLRTERRMTHVFFMDVPAYPKPLLITDAAINIDPDLLTKADIVQNAIDLGIAIGVQIPKVAILSAVETVNPRIPSTIDAAALCKMQDRGQIKGGIVDGPLAFDNAISPSAAETKGILSEVAGHADILVSPDLESGNMIAKQLDYLAGAESAGLVLGARVPIMLTSRADGVRSRTASSALAALFRAKYSK